MSYVNDRLRQAAREIDERGQALERARRRALKCIRRVLVRCQQLLEEP